MEKRDPELDKIEKRMRELGLNQRSLAIQAGCKPDVVRNRLSGKAKTWREDTHKKIMMVLWPDQVYPDANIDDDLMRRCAEVIMHVASEQKKLLPLPNAMAYTVMLYKHILEYRRKGSIVEPNEAIAALILKEKIAS